MQKRALLLTEPVHCFIARIRDPVFCGGARRKQRLLPLPCRSAGMRPQRPEGSSETGARQNLSPASPGKVLCSDNLSDQCVHSEPPQAQRTETADCRWLCADVQHGLLFCPAGSVIGPEMQKAPKKPAAASPCRIPAVPGSRRPERFLLSACGCESGRGSPLRR